MLVSWRGLLRIWGFLVGVAASLAFLSLWPHYHFPFPRRFHYYYVASTVSPISQLPRVAFVLGVLGWAAFIVSFPAPRIGRPIRLCALGLAACAGILAAWLHFGLIGELGPRGRLIEVATLERINRFEPMCWGLLALSVLGIVLFSRGNVT